MITLKATLYFDLLLMAVYARAYNRFNMLTQDTLNPIVDSQKKGMTLESLVGGSITPFNECDAIESALLERVELTLGQALTEGKSLSGWVCDHLNSQRWSEVRCVISQSEYEDLFDKFMMLHARISERFSLCIGFHKVEQLFPYGAPGEIKATIDDVSGKLTTGNTDRAERELKEFFEKNQHPDIRTLCYDRYKEVNKGFKVNP